MATRKYAYTRRIKKYRKRTGRKKRKSKSRKRRKSKSKSRKRRKSKSRKRSGKCPKRCWTGYKRVPGKGCGKGSCTKI